MRGANQFRVDMPRMVAMYLDGRLDLDSMLSSTMSLADVNEGYASMGRGEIARSVIVFEEQARRHRPHAHRPTAPRGSRMSSVPP